MGSSDDGALSMRSAGQVSLQVNWAVFDGFRRPVEKSSLSWAAADAWKAAIDLQFAPKRELVKGLRDHWDDVLREFGGDPHARDWARFRALRRHREEDWSDWLAQLIEDSVTGWFAWRLFGALEERSSADYISPDVQREVSREGFRADLVVLWRDATYTHVEVKVGDEGLEEDPRDVPEDGKSLPRRCPTVVGRPSRAAKAIASLGCGMQAKRDSLDTNSRPHLGGRGP